MIDAFTASGLPDRHHQRVAASRGGISSGVYGSYLG
jgi:hypothetical protein